MKYLWLGGLSLVVLGSIFSQSIQVAYGAEDASYALGASLEPIRQKAQKLSPALQVAALKANEVQARARGADALDDPVISETYRHYKIGTLMTMDMHTIMLSQSIPLWGKLDLRREAAFSELAVARGQTRSVAEQLDETVKVTYARYYTIQQSLLITRGLANLAARLEQAARIRYGAGSEQQSAIFEAQAKKTLIETDAIKLEGEKESLKAFLNVLMGRPANDPIADPQHMRALPARLPSMARLVEKARAGNSDLQIQASSVQAAQYRKTLSERRWYPDLTIGAGPIVQTSRGSVGAAATVGVNVPVPWGKADSEEQEAESKLATAERQYDQIQLSIQGAIADALSKYTTAYRTEKLLKESELPAIKNAFLAILARYGQGQESLKNALSVEEKIYEIETRLLQARLEEQTQLAALERLIGRDVP